MDLKVGVAQLNPTVGDIDGNTVKIVETIKKAKQDGVDIIVLPEMVVTGYPPNDLLLRQEFIEKSDSVIFNQILRETKGICAVVGSVKSSMYNILTNSAIVYNNGQIIGTAVKTLLPNYDVFDEKRYFKHQNGCDVAPICVTIRGQKIRLGVEICEDLWFNSQMYKDDVTELLCKRGADIIINISASPFYTNKLSVRTDLVQKYVRKFEVPFVYANLVGGQDDLVFDGGSFIVDSKSCFATALPQFEEATGTATFNTDTWTAVGEVTKPIELCHEDQIVRAHVLNVRDYFNKVGCFDGIVIGSSGGVDSAYTLYIAEQAVGADKVLSVAMPSKFTSEDSIALAEDLAANLGIKNVVVPIKEMHDATWKIYDEAFGKTDFGVAEENDQARCRMMILMKLSAKKKLLVCSTGNKSELSVGYFTLYGDSAGGKNIPGDLYKTELYDVCKYINKSAGKELIPWGIINRPPTAELKPDQKDTDSLPQYEILDCILRSIENDNMNELRGIGKLVGEDTVNKVLSLYKIAEFKRDQLCKGIKVSPKAFGIGRRIPITNGWQYKCPK